MGVAAEQRTPILIPHATTEYSYARAIRDSAERAGLTATLETAIPLPGLADSGSQLAVPIIAGRALLGVLFVESPSDRNFGYQMEDALVAIAGALALAIRSLQENPEGGDIPPPTASSKEPDGVAAAVENHGATITIKHYAADDSVFIGDDYLIKGVAGSILAKLVRDYLCSKRTEFSNRELRLDPSIRLPDLSDNLEARLVLLQRRLAERSACLQMQRTGRGRFRLCATHPVELVEVLAGRA